MKLVKLFLIIIIIISSTLSRKIKSKVKNKANARQVLRELIKETVLDKFDDDSCSATAPKIFELFCKAVTSIGYDDIRGKDGKVDKEATKTNIIKGIENISTLLNDNKLVYVQIKHDHHFVLLKDSSSENTFIWQSFVKTYHLRDWIKNEGLNNGLYMTADQIVNHLKIIVDPVDPDKNSLIKTLDDSKLEERMKNRTVSLYALFAPNEIVGDLRKKAQDSVDKWFGNEIILSNIYYADINTDVPSKTFWEKLSCFCSCFRRDKSDENEEIFKKRKFK